VHVDAKHKLASSIPAPFPGSTRLRIVQRRVGEDIFFAKLDKRPTEGTPWATFSPNCLSRIEGSNVGKALAFDELD
jgi:hypothetical protein